MPLAKGLALSLLENLPPASWGARPDPHFIDLGVSPASRAWLEEKGIHILGFCRDDFYPEGPARALARHVDAQLLRPFLPRLIPGYDMYMWLDADIWIQERGAIQDCIDATGAATGNMVICPEFHYGYVPFRDLDAMLRFLTHQLGMLYGEEAARASRKRPVLNSGLFALAGNSSLWEKWASELAMLLARPGIPPQALHLAEQMALNRILYEEGRATFLDPIYNYACAASAVTRNARGKVVVGLPPFTPVKAPHLLAFSRYGDMYLEKGLLYAQGRYLDDAEKSALQQLCRR